ncbi:MAG TPA: 2Fe-2S iron-sulfur cluster binding domain-containing protein [Chromatiales bacterium]|nr:2Fe-2S iron-sulfur cluster binding domain-containing protein [Chromatiales bacterium]
MDGCRVTIVPDGPGVTVEPEETILHAALRQGVTLRWGCRFGGCVVTLRSGRIRYEEAEIPLALGATDAPPDAIAVCLAIPESDIGIEIPAFAADADGETGE